MCFSVDENYSRKLCESFVSGRRAVTLCFCRKKTLFKFDKSSITNDGALAADTSSTAAAVKEHRRNASDMSNDETLQQIMHATPKSNRKLAADKVLVCQPNSVLIRNIYLPLIGYVHEIETLMKCKSGQPGSLNAFLCTYVKETFLAKGHHRTLQLTIESLSKNNDAWRAIITPEEMKSYGLTRPLLQSTVLFENSEYTLRRWDWKNFIVKCYCTQE